MADPTLYQKNLLFFTTADPVVAAMVQDPETRLTEAVTDDSGAIVDIDVGGGRLYDRPVGEFVSEQVETYMGGPTRIIVEPPNPADLHDACTRTMAAALDDGAEGQLPRPPVERGGVLLVVGIGLGLHIPELVARTNPRHVVLVEPIGEFLCHSLAAMDWQKLWRQCGDIGATINIVASGDPASILRRLQPLMLSFGEVAIDGSYLYLHYQTDVTRAIASKFHDLAGMTAILKGYYADEKLMVENTIANVTKHDFWLVEGELRHAIDAPAFIVGAGPSLDGCIETLRRWQDRAVIISAGSTLQALLHHGIVPDFHIEKENTQPTVDRIRHIHERNAERFGGEDFGPIRLVASTTVKPGVTELFDEKFLFLRSALSSSEMFGDGHKPTDGTSPYSANAALTLAAIMGFRDIYLFGCDCGAKDAANHHSGETAYYTLDDYPNRGVDFPLTAPGNFGGEVLTNPYFSWSRLTYEQVIAAAGLRAKNCSDGVLITGAAPLPPEMLTLDNEPLDKTAIFETVKTASAHFTPGSYLLDQDLPAVVGNWQGFAAALRDHLDRTLEGAEDIAQFDRQLRAFLDQAAAQFGGVVVMVNGSARSMVPVAAYFLNRAPDSAAHDRLMDIFRNTYRSEIERILDDGSALMATVDTPRAESLQEAG